MADDSRIDVWSEMLTAEWQVAKQKLDWMSVPSSYNHVAALLGGDWPDYIREKHLRPLLARTSRQGLRMLSVGCGSAGIERVALDRDWPISELTCAERDPALVEACARTLDGVKADVRCVQFDMDAPSEPLGTFDVIFFCHSLHHCSKPEALLPFINACLAPDGLVLGMDYFGAPRAQPAFEALPLIHEIFEALPPRLRLNLLTDEIDEEFQAVSPFEIAAHDPSEAPRSSDIRGLLFSLFPIVEIKPLGGTILRPVLTQRAGNFVTETDITIVKLMQIIERLAIATSRVPSDDLFFALSKSRLL